MDGEYLVCGAAESMMTTNHIGWIIRLDTNGSIIWEYYPLVIGNWISAKDIAILDDGRFACLEQGLVYPNSDKYIKITVFDSSGNVEWTENYFESGNIVEVTRMAKILNNGLAITGTVLNQYNNEDAFIFSISENGDSSWVNFYGGTGNERSNDIECIADGGFILTGYTTTNTQGSTDLFIVRTDSTGNEQWTKSYGTYLGDEGNAVKELQDGYYVITGSHEVITYINSQLYLILVDSLGYLCFENDINFGEYSIGCDMVCISEEELVITGYIYPCPPCISGDLLVKFGFNGVNVDNNIKAVLKSFYLYPSSPNPFNAETTISFDLPFKSEITLTAYDISGRQAAEIASGEYPAGHHTAVFDGINLPSGVYFLRLQTGEEVRVQKVVLLK